MLRFGKIKVAKEEFYGAKKPIKNWDLYVDNIVQFCRNRGAWFINLVKDSRKLKN